jgi:hypothetical protein
MTVKPKSPYKRTVGENALLIGGIIMLTLGVFFFLVWLGLWGLVFAIPIGVFMIYRSDRRVNRVRKQAGG